MTLLASSLGGPLHPTNVVTSWLKKCLLSLFESRSPGTFPPFNNNILISNTHIPLYSPQNTNRYRFFRRIKFVSTSGQRSLISDCGKKTPTTETVRMVRGQWLHTSGGGTHVQTYKHVPATCVRMHTVPTCQGQPGHTRRQRCVHVCEALWNVTDQTLRKPLCRHAPPCEAHSASTSLARAASPDRHRLHDPTLSPSPRDATESACLMAHFKTTGY